MLSRFGDWLSVAILRLVILISRPLPFQKRVVWGGKIIGFMVSKVPSASKRINKNMAIAYPQNTDAQNLDMLKTVSVNSGMTLVEFYNVAEFGRELAGLQPFGEGVELLDELIANNKPAIFVSGHFGNGEVFRAYMKSRGKPMALLYKLNRNPHYERMHLNFLLHSGPAFATGRRGMSGMIKHLRSGNMITILHDQRLKGAPLLNFMGHEAHTSLATAEIAAKYDIPIIPFYASRLNNRSEFKLEIEKPIPIGSPAEMAQAMNDSLERQIRMTPDQWYWFHDRWHIYKNMP